MKKTKTELEEKVNHFEFTNGTYDFNETIKYIENNKINIAIKKLEEMLQWSDRIGSDEIYEINEIIKILK